MLGLSTGHARDAADPGACGGPSCTSSATTITAPTGFPWSSSACSFSNELTDDVALEIQLRVPTNAVGFAFDSEMFSFEYPAWVCASTGDGAAVLLSPPPSGSDGQLVFDARHEPLNTQSSFFGACDPTTSAEFAMNCGANCPLLPSPYCPLGTGPLDGTGFGAWGSAGGTDWLETTTPVVGGSTISLRFLVYDDGDGSFDSTVIFDGFRWITSGTVTSGTTPIAAPR